MKSYGWYGDVREDDSDDGDEYDDDTQTRHLKN